MSQEQSRQYKKTLNDFLQELQGTFGGINPKETVPEVVVPSTVKARFAKNSEHKENQAYQKLCRVPRSYATFLFLALIILENWFIIF